MAHSVHRGTDGARVIATDRPDGTIHGTLSADGQSLWWFDDTDGNEFGVWRCQPFGAGPGNAAEALPGAEPGLDESGSYMQWLFQQPGHKSDADA